MNSLGIRDVSWDREEFSVSHDVAAERPERVDMTIDEILERIGTHRRQWLVIIISAFSYAHFSLQSMLATISAQSLLVEWPWLRERPVLFNSVFAAGAFARLIGSLCLLPLLDRFGRRDFLMFCLSSSVVVSSLAALSPNFAVYTVLRSITLMLTSVLPAASTVYSLELVRTTTRALPGMLCQTVAALMVVYGTVVAGAVGAQSGNESAWKWVSLLANAPALLPCALLAALWVETPRFLFAIKQDAVRAWRALTKMARGNEAELKTKLLGEHAPRGSLPRTIHITGLEGTATNEQKSITAEIKTTLAGMWRILKGKDQRLLTYTLGLTWTLQAFSHWGLSSYMTLFYSYIGVNVTWTTAASFFVQLPGQALLYFLMQSAVGRIGSIKIFVAICTTAHIALAIVLACGVSNAAGLTILAMACFLFGGPLWGPIYTYSAESYPTTTRASAMSLFASTTAISTIVTTYVGSISLNQSRTWLFPLIWGVLRFGIVICAFFWKRETNRAMLVDTEKQVSEVVHPTQVAHHSRASDP